MSIAFHTKRLRVYKFTVIPMEQNKERLLFVGFRTDEDRPMVTVNAIVWPNCPMMDGPYVDWLETTSEYRQQGFARELIQGIRKHLGQTLVMDGATPEGDAFCEAIDKPRSRKRSTQTRKTNAGDAGQRTGSHKRRRPRDGRPPAR